MTSFEYVLNKAMLCPEIKVKKIVNLIPWQEKSIIQSINLYTKRGS